MAQMVNCFIKALNDAVKLPRLVLILPDGDLLKHINYNEFGVHKLSADALRWVSTQMDRALETKKENMSRRMPGSVIAHEPKFIWVEMINRVNGFNQYLANHSKFNGAMADMVEQKVITAY